MKKLTYVIATLLLLAGCSIGQNEQPKESRGSLILQLESSNSRIIQPDVEMVISSYEIKAVGPKADFFESSLTTTTPNITKNGLTTGLWIITVKGKNSTGIVIATDIKEVEILENSSTKTNFSLSPLSGKGTLTVELNWPESVIKTPRIETSFISVSGTELKSSNSINSNAFTYSLPNTDSGYYTLALKLYDDTEQVWDMVEAVRIIKGEESKAVITLTVADLNGTTPSNGGINVDTNIDTESPINITFTGFKPVIKFDEEMTVTATTSVPVDTYQWYLNGVLLKDEISNQLIIKSQEHGVDNNLVLIVTSGNILSSISKPFKNYDVRGLEFNEMVYVEGSKITQKDLKNGDYFINNISDFKIGKYEVTYELWYYIKKWAEDKGYKFSDYYEDVISPHDIKQTIENSRYKPVINISWKDAALWCNAYSEYNNLTPVYNLRKIFNQLEIFKDFKIIYGPIISDIHANGYRLPTLGEWELLIYENYNANDIPSKTVYNLDDLNNVGRELSNKLEVFDMLGNAAEFCNDTSLWYNSPSPVEYNYSYYYWQNMDAHFVFGNAFFRSSYGTYDSKYTIVDYSDIHLVGFRVAQSIISKNRTYDVGDNGPAGGIIFYDDEADGIDNIPNYRYLEVSLSTLLNKKSLASFWGYESIRYGANGITIGTGLQNTLTIVESESSGSVINPAELCYEYSKAYNNNIYDDWYLPSIEEIKLIFDIFPNTGISDFSSDHYYWSSSESPIYKDKALSLNSYSGKEIETDKSKLHYVLPIRAF